MIERTKVILGTIIPLIITYLLYLLNGTNNWFDLPSSTFGLICVLLFTFNLLSFIIGVYFLKHNSGKSFVYTFSVIFIKLLLVFGLIGVLIMDGVVTQPSEVFPIMALYIVFTVQQITLLSGIKIKHD